MTTSRRTQADAPIPATAVCRRPARRGGGREIAPQVPATGLYDPRFEHDACGVALVADLHGRRTHTLVRQAISALEHLAHRGATGSEEDSGDGAGILLQVPHDFYADAVDFDLPSSGHYATGIAFLSTRPGRGRRRPPGHRQAGRRGGARRHRMAGGAGRRRHPGVDLRGGHALHAPALRGPGGGHSGWPATTRPWPSTGWPSCCASGPSTRSTTATSPRCRPGPSPTRGCSPPTSWPSSSPTCPTSG